MKPEPYKFISGNTWSQERYDQNKLLDGGITEYKTNDAEDQVKEVVSYCKNTRKAIDIGARFGSFTMAFHKAGFEHVYTIEMLEKFMLPLSMNIDLSRSTVYNFGAWYRTAWGHRAGKTLLSERGGDVRLHSVDDLEVDEIDVLKIDVDGPDRLVLEGSINTVERCRPVIYIEFGWPQKQWDKNLKEFDDIWKILRKKDLGYVRKMGQAEYSPEKDHYNLILIPEENL